MLAFWTNNTVIFFFFFLLYFTRPPLTGDDADVSASLANKHVGRQTYEVWTTLVLSVSCHMLPGL